MLRTDNYRLGSSGHAEGRYVYANLTLRFLEQLSEYLTSYGAAVTVMSLTDCT